MDIPDYGFKCIILAFALVHFALVEIIELLLVPWKALMSFLTCQCLRLRTLNTFQRLQMEEVNSSSWQPLCVNQVLQCVSIFGSHLKFFDKKTYWMRGCALSWRTTCHNLSSLHIILVYVQFDVHFDLWGDIIVDSKCTTPQSLRLS